MIKNFIFLFVILLIAGWLRFYNLNWDQGHYLHPDERLYVNASNIKWPDLNPQMFYYGALPLYVYVLVHRILSPLAPTLSFLIASRMVSALISTITVGFLYLLAKKFLSKRQSLITVLIFTFMVGAIQHAHFITTESWLTLEVVLVTYFSLLFLEEKKSQKKWLWAGLAGMAWGVGIATKIVGLSFGIVTVAAGVVGPSFAKGFGRVKKIELTFLIMIVALVVGIAGSPYNLIDFRSFWREQSYMQGVTVGKFKPPFIIIYENTIPYIYQLTKVLPYIWGPAGILGVVGGVGVVREIVKKPEKRAKLIVLLIWPVVYFLVAGSWYAKFSRYMVPLLPFAAIMAGKGAERLLGLRGIKGVIGKIGVTAILAGQIAYAVFFANEVYGKENTRIAVSRWIYQNIPAGAVVCGEHWDDNLPFSLGDQSADIYRKVELAVYDSDDQQKINTLLNKTATCDYIVLSSRRVWYSIVRNPEKYPFTSKFYSDLFDDPPAGGGKFKLVHEERRLNDDGADETFQSYDHPPVWIFKKVQ